MDSSSAADHFGREIDKEVISLDVHNRIRDLETKLLDFKGNMERRIIQMIEENPQKFLSHLKVQEICSGSMIKGDHSISL